MTMSILIFSLICLGGLVFAICVAKWWVKDMDRVNREISEGYELGRLCNEWTCLKIKLEKYNNKNKYEDPESIQKRMDEIEMELRGDRYDNNLWH